MPQQQSPGRLQAFMRAKLVAFQLVPLHSHDAPMPPKKLLSCVLELEIKHKHGGININYEKATVVWQQFGFGS
jgi:hypothetical protein